MNKREIRKLICSMLIGEGHITKDGCGFIFEHSIKQEDYASWKADLIDTIFINKNLSNRCRRRLTRQKVKNTFYDCYRVELWWKKYLEKFLRKRTYINNIKNVEYLLSQMDSDLHTAIWFMDDGGEMNKGRLKNGKFRKPWYGLFTYGFTEGQVNLSIEWFKQHYKITPNKTYFKPTNSHYLRFSKEDVEQVIFPACSPYFSQLNSMRNKFKYSFLVLGKGSETIEEAPLKKG